MFCMYLICLVIKNDEKRMQSYLHSASAHITNAVFGIFLFQISSWQCARATLFSGPNFAHRQPHGPLQQHSCDKATQKRALDSYEG